MQDKLSKATSAEFRLTFRKCDLSLGIRVLNGQKEKHSGLDAEFDKLKRYVPLAEEIEQYWMMPANQSVSTWHEHLDNLFYNPQGLVLKSAAGLILFFTLH